MPLPPFLTPRPPAVSGFQDTEPAPDPLGKPAAPAVRVRRDPTRFALHLSRLPWQRQIVDLRHHLTVVSDDSAYRQSILRALVTQQTRRGGGLLVLDGWGSASTLQALREQADTNRLRPTFWSALAGRHPSVDNDTAVALVQEPELLRQHLMDAEMIYAAPNTQGPTAASCAFVENVLEGVLRTMAHRRADPAPRAPLMVVIQHVTPWLRLPHQAYAQALLTQATRSGVILVEVFNGEDFAEANKVSAPNLARNAASLAVGPLRQANWAPVLAHPLATKAGLAADHLRPLRGPLPTLVVRSAG